MNAKEAFRLSRDNMVLSVEQDRMAMAQATQTDPGWGLDRIDEETAVLDNSYVYGNTGTGRTIYILDSGLTLTNPDVAAEFSGRASVIYDFNQGGDGSDCNGHGTIVSSAAAGNTKGVAKGANIIMAKITIGCSGSSHISSAVTAFNWLAANAPAGTVVNYSHGLVSGNCNTPLYSTALNNAIIAAHNAGIIIVVAAGNDGCNTANYSPTNISQAFVVGATNNNLLPGTDAKTSFSRTGWNISTFSPGQNVSLINQFGNPVTTSGTSFSAPYVAGIFAVACQKYSTICNSGNTANIYSALRGTGILNTVTNTNGTPLTGATSRLIRQQF